MSFLGSIDSLVAGTGLKEVMSPVFRTPTPVMNTDQRLGWSETQGPVVVCPVHHGMFCIQVYMLTTTSIQTVLTTIYVL